MITTTFSISPLTQGEPVDGILFDCIGSIAVDDDNTGEMLPLVYYVEENTKYCLSFDI